MSETDRGDNTSVSNTGGSTDALLEAASGEDGRNSGVRRTDEVLRSEGVALESVRDGGATPIDSGLLQPRAPDRFQRLGRIAEGGMGRIDAAMDPVLGRSVALKTLHPDPEATMESLLRFAEEAQVTGQLEHPNMVPIYDFGGAENDPVLVMKLIHGKSLGQILAELSHSRPPQEQLRQLIRVLLRVCDALAHAHSRGVIHCDVKPDNVMVGEHGQVYLMDWGVATLLSNRGNRDEAERKGKESWIRVPTAKLIDRSSSMGTPGYMAPEQLGGRLSDIDPRTDVYGVGGILYEILTGRLPNSIRLSKETGGLGDPERSPHRMFDNSNIWPHIPPELCRITTKALAAKPDERYASIDELQADLEQFLDGGGWFATRTYAAGELIVEEGQQGDEAFIIVEGQCIVWKAWGEQRKAIRRLAAGDVFGEIAVLAGGQRTASVEAETDVTVKVISGEGLEQELDRNPWLAAFVRTLADRFLEADRRLNER